MYVEANCGPCARARALAQYVREAYPFVEVYVQDLATTSDRPPDLVATPTYYLDGQLYSLGNPSRAALDRAFATRGAM